VSALLKVENLVKHFPVRSHLFSRSKAVVHAVDGLSFELNAGETMALVGESGCGKSTVGRLVLRLLDASSGHVWFDGEDLMTLPAGRLRAKRRELQMIFQDPYSSLNPRMNIGQLVGEGLRLVPGLSSAERQTRVAKMLDEVGLQPQHAQRYAHELSGGQRQRVAIARALIRQPAFVIADEPVSALDVTVRAQVLALLAELQERHGFACLFISHDLGVVEQVADRVIVMQAGRIIEQGSRDEVFDHPQHAYTRKLLSAIPALTPTGQGGMQLKWRFDDPDTSAAINPINPITPINPLPA
jgi:peptide/nickel transport system ATP-binding protein